MPIGGALRLKGTELPTQKNTSNSEFKDSSKGKSRKRKRKEDDLKAGDKNEADASIEDYSEIGGGNNTSDRNDIKFSEYGEVDDANSLSSEKRKKKKRKREKEEKKKKRKEKEMDRENSRTEETRDMKEKDEAVGKGVKYNKFYVPVDDNEVRGKTIAQQIFEKMRDKRDQNKYKDTKSISYKERVEEFNEKLRKKVEYNSIPKISYAGNG